MEDRETQRMRKYEESKTPRIMMATVPHVTSASALRKFQADGFLFDRVYRSQAPGLSGDNTSNVGAWSMGGRQYKTRFMSFLWRPEFESSY